MRLTFFGLYNYNIIEAAMGRTSVEIPFNLAKHPIIILSGPNGSGKSAILKELHPFAESIDPERPLKEVAGIGEDKLNKPVKRIEYLMNDGTTVKIKHILNPMTGTVKSFIAVNDIEMNPNGNVGSFKDAVFDVMQITPDYLKITQMGNNSRAFIKLSPAKRKEFVIDFLRDLDVYTKLHRKVQAEFRDISRNIKNIEEKIRRLNVEDINSLMREIDVIKEKIMNITKDRDSLQRDSGICVENVKRIMGETETHSINDLIERINKFEVDLSNLEGEASLIEVFTEADRVQLSDKMIKLDHLLKEIERMKQERIERLEEKDKKYKELEKSETYLEKLTGGKSSQSFDSLKELLDKHVNERNEYAKLFKNFHPSCTVEDFKTAINILDDLNRHTVTLLSMDTQARDEVFRFYKDGNGSKVVKHIDSKVRVINSEIAFLDSRIGNTDRNTPCDPMMVVKSINCKGGCPYENFYKETIKEQNKPVTELEKERGKYQKQMEVVEQQYVINNIVKLIEMTIQANSALSRRLPNRILDLNNILECISRGTPIKDDEYIHDFINMLERFELMAHLNEQILEIESSVKLMEDNKEMIEILNNTINALKGDIEGMVTIESINERIDEVESEIASITFSIERLRSKKTLYENSEHILTSLEATKTLLNDVLIPNKDKWQESNIKYKQLTDMIHESDKELKRLNDSMNDANVRMSLYNQYKADIEELNDDYVTTGLLEEALSSKDGIPIDYVRVFMYEINLIVNDMLATIYSGDLRIGKIVINADEFTIPYIRNGKTISDIRKSSQGEQTFISLAFAQAFFKVGMGLFNIPLMDELDGPLDKVNKVNFVTSIKNMMDINSIDQAIVVSHSPVFDDEEASVIITGFAEGSHGYKRAQVLFDVNRD